MIPPQTPSRRLVPALAGLALAALALAACVPEPAPDDTPSSSSGPATTAAGTPSPEPEQTATATPAAVPADCTEIYSPTMLASLEEQNPPLNDPGVTMYSTEQAVLLELLDAVPTLRCSWGVPSDFGLATNVSSVDAAQASAVLDALATAGFGCETSGEATICRIEQRGVSLDDVEYSRGEVSAVRDGLWISTSWINFAPDGYTEDILATLAG